jgi:hypothetical protein
VPIRVVMSTTHYEEIASPENEVVLRWRFEELMRAGFDAGSALILAGHAEVDLHAARRLVERGCAPDLALRIVL